MVIKIHNPLDNHPKGLFAKVSKEMALANDWLAGTPMTHRDRVSHDVVENDRWRHFGILGY